MVSPWRRPADDAQPGRVKAMGLRMFAWAALTQAAADGYDHLILLDDRGKVAEAVSSNLFLVRGGVLATPPATSAILEGITRASVLELARDDPPIACREREVDRSELVDQAGTQPIYQALFADALPAEDPAHQPQSFAVVLRGNVDATLFVTELYGTEGVGEVAPVDGQACQIASGEIDLDSP